MNTYHSCATDTTIAALDLGSNSFHLLLAEVRSDGWHAQLRSGDKVQLAAGLRDGLLEEGAIQRGLSCIERLAALLQPLPPAAVRVVGTHTLRVARNRDAFIEPAQRLLGHRIEVISGATEASLVYRGVADDACPEPQLVIDIGGGSTELALGQGSVVAQLASIPVGCVTCRAHFPDDRLDPILFGQAYRNVCTQLRTHWPHPLPHGVAVTGSSGTLLAVEQVLIGEGWTEAGITREGLQRLERALLVYQRLDAVQFPGLSARRRSVFATGVVIARALFDTLGIETMRLSSAALREGLVTELLAQRAAGPQLLKPN
jgi:exopolyphosphatase/guanosine-5'-triphosphate,3'-diphosphate pyrophosphatase